MNATCCLVNYPATIGLMLWLGSEPTYICVMAVLYLNKMPISFFSSKVRQHLENPGYIENEKKFRELADRTLESIQFPKGKALNMDDYDSDSPVKGSALESEKENTAEMNEFDAKDKEDGGDELVNLMPTQEDASNDDLLNRNTIAPEAP